MKNQITYVVKALYNEKENGRKYLHQKKFYSSSDLLKNRNSAQSYFNLIIKLLQDCNLLEIEYRTNTIFVASKLYHRKINSVFFVENHRKAQGIRFGFKVNNDTAKQFNLNSKAFYELDFVDHSSKERNQKTNDNQRVERRILQTLYPAKIDLLKKSDFNFDVSHITKLVKEQDIFELQMVKNLDDISLIFESACAFLNSEKGGYLLFRNLDERQKQIKPQEFENIVDIIKNQVFYQYKKYLFHTSIPGIYFFEDAVGTVIPIIKVNPVANQNATYKSNNLSYKFIRHKVFGNLESLD